MKPPSKLVAPDCELHAYETISDYELRYSRHESEERVNYTLDSMAHAMSRHLRDKMTVSWSDEPALMARRVHAKVYVFSEGDLVDFANRVRADAVQSYIEAKSPRRMPF